MRKKSDQKSLEGVTNDPATYEAMRVPHESAESVQDALRAFMADVKAARIKHRITDVSLVLQPRYLRDEEPTACVLVMHLGEGLQCLPMLAQAYGEERRRVLAKLDAAAGGE